jgi:hypothetical protein
MAKRKQSEKTHQIGDSGELAMQWIFREWDWRGTKPARDYGGDLYVEVGGDASQANRAFLAQVKTTTTLPKPAGTRTVRIRNSAARHLRSHTLPAFALYVEKATRRVFWHFISDVLDRNEQIDIGAAASIAMPPEQVFSFDAPSPPDELMARIEAAMQYVASRQATSTVVHVQNREQYLSNLDPRYRVQIEASSKHERIGVSPVSKDEVLKFLLTIPNREQLRESYEWGAPSTARDASLTLPNSRLWRAMGLDGSSGAVEFAPHPTWEGPALLGVLEKAGEGVAITNPMNVRLSQYLGNKGMRLMISHHLAKLEVELRIAFDGESGEPSIQLDIPRRGELLSIGQLHELSGVAGWIAAMQEGRRTGLQRLDGEAKPILPLTMQLNASDDGDLSLDDIIDIYAALEALGSIAGPAQWFHTKIDLSWVNFARLDSWRMLASLARGEAINFLPEVVRVQHALHEGAPELADLLQGAVQMPTVLKAEVTPKVTLTIPVQVQLSGFLATPIEDQSVLLTPLPGASQAVAVATGPITFSGLRS